MSILKDPKTKIKIRLSTLDRDMPRALEDLIIEQMKTGYMPHQKQLDIINLKQELRLQLAGLED